MIENWMTENTSGGEAPTLATIKVEAFEGPEKGSGDTRAESQAIIARVDTQSVIGCFWKLQGFSPCAFSGKPEDGYKTFARSASTRSVLTFSAHISMHTLDS
ncbi:hypothetical protein L596_004446 [Steinernema carpocapsae]|uniref:Uncharacterized protein n=1 Tax=Steinernema carpocapsae TaxID=34508 RepID=A0A4U8UWW0_STECR|nr:hypothetical protein L596_004446 [Steinernema carpocapsae]